MLLLLLPPIYRDGRRRQVADVLSRPRSLPSNVPVTLPVEPTPPHGLDALFSWGMGWGVPRAHPAGTLILPEALGSAWCSSLGCQHQKVKLSPEHCVALPTGAWQPPHRPHRPCPTCRAWGHRAVCAGDRAMPAGVTCEDTMDSKINS